jgi:hypothetical protein
MGAYGLGVRNHHLYQIASVSCGTLTGTLVVLMLDELEPCTKDIVIETLTLILTTLTAVGAIWAAFAATRQSRAATRQAQAAEESVAHQERYAREQAERQRLAFNVDLILKLLAYFESDHFLETRRRTGKYIKDQCFLGEGDLIPMEYPNNAAAEVLNFMELLGYLVKNEAIDAQAIWERFGVFVVMYWTLCKPAIENVRKLQKAPWSWEDFEFLNSKMIELMNQHSGTAPNFSKEDLRAFAQLEAVIGTNDEQPDPYSVFRRPHEQF